jgi:hypothetical protein
VKPEKPKVRCVDDVFAFFSLSFIDLNRCPLLSPLSQPSVQLAMSSVELVFLFSSTPEIQEQFSQVVDQAFEFLVMPFALWQILCQVFFKGLYSVYAEFEKRGSRFYHIFLSH